MRNLIISTGIIGILFGIFALRDDRNLLAQSANPDITIDYVFHWNPPASGIPQKYQVAVDNPAGVQLAPPGTVEVIAPTTQVTMSSFLSGRPLGDGYSIYVRAVDANLNAGPYLLVPFDFVGIGPPTGGTFALP